MDFLSGLNPQQQEAVRHADGPMLILAGAGSGKTRVITHRICHLVHAHRVHGPSILAVTFTNKAAGEMRERVARLLEESLAGDGPLLSTFHSFCVRLLRRDGDALAALRPGFTRQFTIYDDDDQLAIIKRAYKTLGLDDKFLPYRSALSIISEAKNLRRSPQEFHRSATNPKADRLSQIYQHYEEALRKANALDFDDLLLEAVRLLRHDEPTRAAWNRRLRYLLIDEYQDTNRTQYELMRLLSQQHGNVCVVGDEDQSIYGWRGADIRNILDFEKDFPQAKVIRLEQNYRSTKTILEAAGAVVARNTARKGKWLWTEAGAGSRIGLYEAPTAENEALFIADTIESTLRAEPDCRVAVLYRTNSQSRQIEEALRRYGRKYLVVGGLSFYQRAEVKDALAYLKLLLSPRDGVSLLRILNVPARGIGKTTMEQLDRIAAERGCSLWEALGLAVEGRLLGARAEAAVGAFIRLIEELREAALDAGPDAILREVLERSGYRRVLEKDPAPDSEARLANLDELHAAATEAAVRGESLADFLDHAALVADADNLDERAQVSLLTMHNAKGLEFPVVFLAGLEEGLFPHSRSRDSEEKLEEERRLCYVGMTRAERRLYLSWARYRRRFGGSPPEASIPSRFLKEVPSHLLEPLSPEQDAGQVDLYAERHAVRESAQRNTYTGKTYNSIEHISQFFAERGKAFPVSAPQPQAAPPAAQPAAVPQARPAAAAAAPSRQAPRTGIFPGARIEHEKYGRGTVLRKEGDGDEAKLTIHFERAGLKKLIAKFAGLKTA
jgi:DNA helicase-2/ATP-dependent DNA helicase PcrA